MLNFQTIKDFIDEIQYYEQIGYHKTADKLTKAIQKLAWDFNAGQMGFGAYADNVSMLAGRARIMEILKNTPACTSMMNDFHNQQPVKWSDPRDCRSKLTQQWQQQNPGQTITPDVLENIQEQCANAIDNPMNAVANNTDPNFMSCMEALSNAGQIGAFSEAFPNIQIPQNLNQQADPILFPSTNQQQPRNVPRIV